MAKPEPSFSDQSRNKSRPGRLHRPYLWNLAACLANGSIAMAFYLAWHASRMGVLALVAFLCGFVLRQLLEATSVGD